MFPKARITGTTRSSSRGVIKFLEPKFRAACKRTQQLPTLFDQQCWELLRTCWQRCVNGCNNSQHCWDLQCIVGRIQPIILLRPCVMSARGSSNVGRAVQTDPTFLRYTSAITEQKKCWELLAEKFDWFQTFRNNMQKGVQTDATCNIQQCWGFLANNVASVCTKPKTATYQNSSIIRCTRVWNIVADELKLRMNALNDFKQAMAESVTKPPKTAHLVMLLIL